jgi:hypothetical protein
MNTKLLYDIIIKQATITFPDGRAPIVADIGINLEEVRDSSGFTWKGRIVDFGDLSVFSANEQWNGIGRSIIASAVEMNEIVDLDTLQKHFA